MFPYSRAARVRHIYLSCFICLGVGYISYNAILALRAIFAHRKLKTTPSKNIFISSCKQVFFSILTQSDKCRSWGFVWITPILSKICTDMTKFSIRKQLYDFNRSNIVQCCPTFSRKIPGWCNLSQLQFMSSKHTWKHEQMKHETSHKIHVL